MNLPRIEHKTAKEIAASVDVYREHELKHAVNYLRLALAGKVNLTRNEAEALGMEEYKFIMGKVKLYDYEARAVQNRLTLALDKRKKNNNKKY